MFSHLSMRRPAVLAVAGSVLLTGLFAAAGRAYASVARTLSLTEMSQSAEIVADVTVQSVQSYWAAPGGVKAIRTRVQFAVNQAVKGNPGKSLTLDFLGGQVGNQALKVPGLPQFLPGERYVLFSAGPDKALVCPVLGLDQGAMRVIHDNESNADRVFRDWGQPVSANENFETRAPVTPGVTTRDYLRSADTVDQFLARVRQATTSR